jgi:hypothetical protein
MNDILLPTYLEVKCKCGKLIQIRTSQKDHHTPCWSCPRVIHVHLGSGKNNLSVYIGSEKIKPIAIYQ